MSEENKIPDRSVTKIPRFSAVKYDEVSQHLASAFRKKFEELEHTIDTHLNGDREASLALTCLELAHTFVGKAIRNNQIRRSGNGTDPK